MSEFDPIAGWFEKGFQIRAQKAARTAKAGRSRAGGGGGGSGGSGGSSSGAKGVQLSAGANAKNAVSVVRKAPEVMVKITGNSSGTASVKHHLDYISRNGDVELTNESGESIKGRSEVAAVVEQFKAAQIPKEGTKREFLHVLFSMPAGTPEKEMRAAVQDFCKEEFGNRRYLAAFHDDTDHVHVHVCVGTRDIEQANEPRLSPRKSDLACWRQGFADKLRENGIDAAASQRSERFNFRKPENAVVRQIRADNPASAVYNESRAKDKALDRAMKAATRPETAFVGPVRAPREAKIVTAQKMDLVAALKSDTKPANPYESKIQETKEKTLSSWGEVAKNLQASGQNDLANELAALMRRADKPVASFAQEIYDKAKASKVQEVDHER